MACCFLLLLFLMFRAVDACHTESFANPEVITSPFVLLDNIAPSRLSPTGFSPSQHALPPLPPASKRSCGHNAYYFNDGRDERNGIVGGITSSKLNEFPWLVRLVISYADNSVHMCSGSLISSRWLITSAHCVRKARNITAVFGDRDKYTNDLGEFAVAVSAINPHPSFNDGQRDYDVALLRLASPVTAVGGWKMPTICLPHSCSDGCRSEATAYIAGWGSLNAADQAPSRYLQKAYVKIIDEEKCRQAYRPTVRPITDQMLCAGWDNGNVDGCLGDSGGPLMVNEDGFYKLCAISSFGLGCGRPGFYGVYTKICKVLPWVNDALAMT